MQVLDIDPNWRMHTVSEGQRRRVQICVGLLKPFKVSLRHINAWPLFACLSFVRDSAALAYLDDVSVFPSRIHVHLGGLFQALIWVGCSKPLPAARLAWAPGATASMAATRLSEPPSHRGLPQKCGDGGAGQCCG